MRLHAYADDTQLYLKCQAQEATTAAHTLEACITDVTACSGVGRILVWGGGVMAERIDVSVGEDALRLARRSGQSS